MFEIPFFFFSNSYSESTSKCKNLDVNFVGYINNTEQTYINSFVLAENIRQRYAFCHESHNMSYLVKLHILIGPTLIFHRVALTLCYIFSLLSGFGFFTCFLT